MHALSTLPAIKFPQAKSKYANVLRNPTHINTKSQQQLLKFLFSSKFSFMERPYVLTGFIYIQFPLNLQIAQYKIL